MGGAQAINYLVSLLRVKVVAVLLGPAGVGVIGLYTSATNLLGTVTGLGLQRSAVRTIAVAQGQGDEVAVASAIRMLRRLCWLTGILGWLACVALAVPLSRMMFKSTEHAWALAVLGGMLLLSAINGGQLALLRGLRRIGDIARVQVASAMVSTAVIIALFAWLRERGIVPVLLASAAVSLTTSWWFVRRIQVADVGMSWRRAITEAGPMVSLGITLMLSSTLTVLLEFYTRTLLSRGHGLDAVGIYQAAWALSGMFAGFVLTAMGTDFYPRLAAVIENRNAAAREINQQTEVGILLALPGLLVTLAFAKFVVWLLYSAKFAPAVDVLAWMTVGVFGRVVSWPMGYIQMAMNAKRWYLATETSFILFQAAMVTWWVPQSGAKGAAYAFATCYAVYTIAMAWLGYVLIGFRWSPAVVRMMLVSGGLVGLTFAANRLLPDVPAMALSGMLAFVGGVWCLRGLVQRLGSRHKVTILLLRVPGLRSLLGVRE